MASYNEPIVVRVHAENPEYNGGVYGESKLFNGVRGVCYAPGHGAVVGVSENHTTEAGPGVFGQSDGTGVWGLSKTWCGVYGESPSTTGGAGVWGEQKANGAGVFGKSNSGDGVFGTSENGRGVVGVGKSATGVEGNSTNGAGVFGSSQTGIGIHGKGGRLAGFFEGVVEVTGDIQLTNGDCAEDFDVADADQVEAGTVLVLGEDERLHQSVRPYDKRVAGVVSGAADLKPAIVLDRHTRVGRKPVALVGKTYCKVDAQYASIEVGDLLTTSPTLGHAMKADDPHKAFGAVIGKALRSFAEGRGLIPILIALQ